MSRLIYRTPPNVISFGLTDLANVHMHSPRCSVVEGATSGRVTFLRYTHMVKPMHHQSNNPDSGKNVWERVSTQWTLHEIIEVVHESVPFEARMEVVIANRTLSFLSSFCHEMGSSSRYGIHAGRESTHHLHLFILTCMHSCMAIVLLMILLT